MHSSLAPNRFCLLTTGRSGSTSLMNFLAKFDDIALPCIDVECADNELLNPKRAAQYAKVYAARCALPVNTVNDLIECFYRVHGTATYAGFKSMPNRHPDFDAFAARSDIRFITLVREDIVSTVASLLVAIDTGFWRRVGEPHSAKWRFDLARDEQRVLSNLAYVLQSNEVLRLIPDAIALTYEELCEPNFRSSALNHFFARHVCIENPRPPTHGSSYVENWDEFAAFVQSSVRGVAETADGSGWNGDWWTHQQLFQSPQLSPQD